MDTECDPLDITSGDLALLQDSHNIEFVVEDDDEDQTSDVEGDPAYHYTDNDDDSDIDDTEDDDDGVTHDNDDSIVYDNDYGIAHDNDNAVGRDDDDAVAGVGDGTGQDNNIGDVGIVIDSFEDNYQEPDDVTVASNVDDSSRMNDVELPFRTLRKRGNTSSTQTRKTTSPKITNKRSRISFQDEHVATKITRIRASSASQLEHQIVIPQITNIQGGSTEVSTSPTRRKAVTRKTRRAKTTTNTVSPKISYVQGGTKLLCESTSSGAGSTKEPKLIPDRAVMEIVRALGLSAKDIEKHGGTVAISIPETLIQDGVLDLTKLTVANNPNQIQMIPPNVSDDAPQPANSRKRGDNSTRNTKKIVPILPKTKCYVEGCETYEDKDRVFFTAPADSAMRKIWDICLVSVNRRLSLTDKICGKHFYKSDIIYIVTPQKGQNPVGSFEVRLFSGAVPSINYHESCCVPICDTKEPERMYNFPVYNKTNTELWIYMIKNPSLKTLNIRELLRHRVCSKHFDSDSFSPEMELRRTAAPTKNLPVPDYKSMKMLPTLPSLPDFTNMKLYCAYIKCRNRLNPKKRVFPFPSEFDRCQEWLYACDRLDLLCPTSDATMTKLYYLKFGLCETHFEDREYEDTAKRFLWSGAMPRYFDNDKVIEDKQLPNAHTSNEVVAIATEKSDDGEGDLVETSREKSKKILPYVCFYLGCNRKNYSKKDSKYFFSFPVEPQRRKQWLEACGYKNFGEVEVTYKICKLHFAPRMFDKEGKLKSDAVPIRSTQIIDGPSQSSVGPGQTVEGLNTRNNVRSRKKYGSGQRNDDCRRRDDRSQDSVDSNEMIFNPSQDDPDDPDDLYETVNAMVSKWVDKAKLEFLRCAIPNCDKVFTNHSYMGKAQLFPNPIADQEWYDLWLNLIGSPILKAMTPDILRQTYVICNKHFDENCLIEYGMSLVPNAAPTKDLPSHREAEMYIEKPRSVSANRSKTSHREAEMYIEKPRSVSANRSKTKNNFWSADGLQWKQLDSVDLADSKDKTTCFLEDTNIVFPGMGYYLVDYQKDSNKGTKRPYGIYQYKQSKLYKLTDDIEFGEALNIHTAIIIDDNDAAEREVIQTILDRRMKLYK